MAVAETVLYLDVGSPYAYLAAERVAGGLVDLEPRWEPVLLGGIFRATGRSSWARTGTRDEGMREIEERALSYGLPPLVWPEPWPGDMLRAMRAATAAAALGTEQKVAFLLAAMRLGFQQGRDLGLPDAIADAASAAGLDPDALLTATDDPGVRATLRARTDAALAAGVFGIPTATVGAELFWGDDRLDEAAAAAAAARQP